MPKFYSQFGEDRILNAAFEELASGTCVEVGVNDPVHWSNSYFFEKAGWSTILVEPNPEVWDRIASERTGRLFRCAASDRDGSASLLIARNAVGLSTLERSRSDAIAKAEGSIHSVEVPLRTLNSMLREAGVSRVDFLSVDVEGHEATVLRGFDAIFFKPRVILVERNRMREGEVSSHLRTLGYTRFLATGCNDWYAREDDRELRRRARNASTLADSAVVVRERVRLATLELCPTWFIRGVRRLKHTILGVSPRVAVPPSSGN